MIPYGERTLGACRKQRSSACRGASTSNSCQFVKSVSDKLLVKLRIVSAAREQFVMRAALNDRAVPEDKNLVGVANGRKPVGDDEAGAALEQLFQRALNQRFSARIDRAGRLVENQDARARDHRANETYQLSFAGAEV